MEKQYIQVGFTAMRDPKTGEFLPAVPLYIQMDYNAEEAEEQLIDGLGNLLARRIKAYKDSCAKAGVPL